MTSPAKLALCAAMVLAFPSVSFAQHAVVWPGLATEPDAVAMLPPAALEAAAQACVARRVSLIALAEVEREIGNGPLSRCSAADCAQQMASELGVDAVVLVTMLQRQGQAATIIVEVVTSEQSFSSPEVAVDGDLPRAVRRATNQAWALWDTGRSLRVRVTSEPPGALVHAEDEELGTTPFHRRMSLGEHALRFELEGFEPLSHSVTLTPDFAGPIHVELIASGGEGAGSGPDTGLLITGATLAGLGAAAILAIPIAAATTGCIETAANGPCAVERRLHEGASYAWGISGAVVLSAGLTLLVVSFAVGEDDGVTVQAGPGSIMLQGRF